MQDPCDTRRRLKRNVRSRAPGCYGTASFILLYKCYSKLRHTKYVLQTGVCWNARSADPWGVRGFAGLRGEDDS